MKKPEEGCQYLCYIRSIVGGVLHEWWEVMFWDGATWESDTQQGYAYGDEIVAWQELPEPPKTETA